jgi:hypothetical protein
MFSGVLWRILHPGAGAAGTPAASATPAAAATPATSAAPLAAATALAATTAALATATTSLAPAAAAATTLAAATALAATTAALAATTTAATRITCRTGYHSVRSRIKTVTRCSPKGIQNGYQHEGDSDDQEGILRGILARLLPPESFEYCQHGIPLHPRGLGHQKSAKKLPELIYHVPQRFTQAIPSGSTLELR